MRYAWLAVVLVGCSSSTDVPVVPPSLSLLAGQETDTWTGSSPATMVNVETVQPTTGARMLIATAPAPASQIALPQGITTPVATRFEATGVDATGAAVVWGSTVPFGSAGFGTFGVSAFVARSGGWSRAPQGLAQPHLHPLVAQAFSSALLVVGGDAVGSTDLSAIDSYDLDLWSTITGLPKLPLTPKSVVVGYSSDPDGIDVDIEVLAVNETNASWFNASLGITDVAITAPTGLTFAEVAGGASFILPDSTTYIVGATRQDGAPTDKVLRIGATGTFQALTLNTPRVGAAAAVLGSTLLVVGGSTDGAGAEILDAMETAFVPLALPAEPTAGAGVAALDKTNVISAGGKDPTTGMGASLRTLDTSCTASCTWTDVTSLPLALGRAAVFVEKPTQWIVLGESDDGANHAFSIDTSGMAPSVVEQPLREPRKGATPLLLPNSQVGLLGGERLDTGAPTLTIEAFFP